MRVQSRLLIPAFLAIASTAASVGKAETVPTPRIDGKVIVEERRVPGDEQIKARVIERLAAMPRLEGLIGVESHDAVVTLSGWTRTSAQAGIAETEARKVEGVAYVHNEIRPRMSA